MTLPQGWEASPIGDLCDLINGKAFKPTDWASSGLPIIRIQNLNRSDADFNYCDGDIDERFVVEPGELLFAWSGTPGTSFGAHVWGGSKAVLNQHIFRVRFNEAEVDRDYFKRAINSTLDELIGKAHGGVGLAHVTKGKFEATVIPIPPAAEQRRIVAKLDALTTRLARTRAELDRVPVLAATLRREVLSQAVAGDLTAEWRADQHGKNEDSSQPLAGWNHATLAELSGPTGLVSDGDWVESKDQDPGGVVRLTQLADIGEGVFRDRSRRFMTTDAAKRLRCTYLEQDDVLIARMPDPMGRACLFPGLPQPAVTAVDVFIWRGDGIRANPQWVVHTINSPVVRERIEAQAGGTTRQRIAGGKLKALELSVPPLDEQGEIVRRIDVIFARADRLEAEATRARALIDRLEAAILARAFRGELVPQNPADEPASVLLDRIRTQRAAAPKPKRGRRASAAA